MGQTMMKHVYLSKDHRQYLYESSADTCLDKSQPDDLNLETSQSCRFWHPWSKPRTQFCVLELTDCVCTDELTSLRISLERIPSKTVVSSSEQGLPCGASADRVLLFWLLPLACVVWSFPLMLASKSVEKVILWSVVVNVLSASDYRVMRHSRQWHTFLRTQGSCRREITDWHLTVENFYRHISKSAMGIRMRLTESE